MNRVTLALVIVACGDNRPIDAGVDVAIDMAISDLFGEACVQPTFPAVGICHDGQGACHDETAGPVCRPFCHVDGVAQCVARRGVEVETDRGACVCVPSP